MRFLPWWVLFLGLLLSCSSRERGPVTVDCPDITAGCLLPANGLLVRFDRQPKPMERFHVTVRMPEAHEVHARFVMRGMEMGLNRYRLLPADGEWRTEAMLPVCIQGRSDWELHVEADGRTYVLPFKSG